jgi:hypothetical protein
MASCAETLSRLLSRCVPVVEAEQATQTLATMDPTIAARRLRGGHKQVVSDALVIPFAVIVVHELRHRFPKMPFSHRHDAI